MQPDVITDLIDMIALYRPGAMDTGSHKKYIARRFGREEPEYDFMLEEVVIDTYGLIVYQEQVMEATKVLGGFTLQEADDIRRAMGKKKFEVIKPYKDKFVNNAISLGCNPREAEHIWNKLEVFAGYGFCKAHATAYAITGYISQWFKSEYPVHFWTISFEYVSKDELIPRFLSEIQKISKMYMDNGYGKYLDIIPVDINMSGAEFITDYNDKKIYWSLNQIAECGDSASGEIIDDRNKNGEYFSFNDFFNRVNRKRVNKKVITNLIFSGCFDDICNIVSPKDRKKIFDEYFDMAKVDPIEFDADCEYDFWRDIMQRDVSGIGLINYKDIIINKKYKGSGKSVDAISIMSTKYIGKRVIVAGRVIRVSQIHGKKGGFGKVVIDNNNDQLHITVWSDQWSLMKDILNASKDKNIIINGVVSENKYIGGNQLETDVKTELMVLNY
jgi:DNA polymerase III alpha subunit